MLWLVGGMGFGLVGFFSYIRGGAWSRMDGVGFGIVGGRVPGVGLV